MEDAQYRMRAKRKLLKATFPNGKEFCYSNVTTTMIEVLKEIGSDKFPLITLEMCKLRLVSQEIYPRFKSYMKPICDGWYLNGQSNTDTKYLQLRAINDSLQLGLTIDLGDDFEPQENPNKGTQTRPKDKLLVKFADGEYIANDSSLDTFLEAVWKIGINEIARKDIQWCGRSLITPYKENNRQVQVDTNRWINAPTTTKDRAKLLRVIALHLKLNLEITII